MLLCLVAFPALASAATQTLTVKKAGAGAGTVTSSPPGFIECGATCSAPFTEGSTVVLKAVSGANTAAVVWSGCDKVNLEDECTVTMSTAKTITATFNLLERKLTLEKKGSGTGTVTSSPTGIDCGTSCSASFVKGTTVTLTGAPGPKTLAPSWSGCDSFDAEGKCLVTMSAARTVTVAFEATEYPLTVKKAGAGSGTVTSSPSGIECGLTCSASFANGALVTLTGSPGAGSDPAVQWSGCDSVNGEGKCLVTMSSAKAVTATFGPAKWSLVVSKVGSGTGTVTSSPSGIDCGASCSAGFLNATKVTLEGKAGLHTKAVKWSGCKEVTTESKCRVTMTAATNVIASFELESQYLEHTITVRLKGTGKGSVASQPGGIQCGEDCTEKYLHKTSLTLTPSPATGSVFDHWVGGGCAAFTGPCQTTVNSSSLVRAYFVAVGNRTLGVAKAGSGQGTVTSKTAGIDCGSICSVELDASTRVALHATPAAGSTFSGWSGEGCIGTGACRVLMNEARNVTATFAKLPGPTPGPSEVFVSSAARVRGGKAMLRVACNGPSPCQGTLKLLLKIRNAEGKTKGLVVGVAPFSLAAGTVQTLAVKLSQRAMRLLSSTGRLRLRIVGASESHALMLGARPSQSRSS